MKSICKIQVHCTVETPKQYWKQEVVDRCKLNNNDSAYVWTKTS